MKEQFQLEVGIMAAPIIRFVFRTPYLLGETTYTGEHSVMLHEGRILFDGKSYDELIFRPDLAHNGASFMLRDVIIGVGFHWQRPEDQVFEGSLKFIVEEKAINGAQLNKPQITAINLIGIEDYLTSVISSEMSPTSSLELLKAHAITSRSWVLYPILSNNQNTEKVKGENTDERHIVWYERDAHTRFHVCADDHCQRYQGITRLSAAKENVRKAIEATWGLVIKDQSGQVCDARFYKACGGATELFENAWADTHFHYLEPILDDAEGRLDDLTNEENAIRWIRTSPRAFCNTHDARILSQVLNDYDQETTEFYRWKVSYTQEELSAIVKERSGIDFGQILDLQPIRRGPSGRIVELKIIGSNKTMVVGKELEIRKWLSKSHLYSSAFVVDKQDGKFILTGAGWGHGVGLCQIGAAVMADQGYSYDKILAHYFPGSKLESL